MTVTVAAKTETFTNGTANDAVPVNSEFAVLFNNDASLATEVNLIGGGVFTFAGNKTFSGLLRFSQAAITIASGSITPTKTWHVVDTEAAAPADDLDNIVANGAGQILTLRTTAAARVVTLKHLSGGTGNIYLADESDLVLDNPEDTVSFFYDSAMAKWVETARSKRLQTSREATIASGAISSPYGYLRVDTELDAATDDLDTINGGVDGKHLIIRPENASRVVTVRHNIGNIMLSGNANFTFRSINENLSLLYDSTIGKWIEIGRAPSAMGRVLLATATASNSATLDFSGFFSSRFNVYEFDFIGIVPATDGANLLAQVSIAASFQTSNYRWGALQLGENTGGYAGGSAQSAVQIMRAIGNASGEGASGKVRVSNPLSTTLYKQIQGSLGGCSTTTQANNDIGGGMYTGGLGALDGFRLLMSSGNITSGIVNMYGVNG